MEIPPEKVLLIDASPERVKSVQKLLKTSKSKQFSFVQAKSLPDAHRVLEQGGVAVILMSSSFKKITAAAPQVPVILLTDQKEKVDEAEARKLGAHAVFDADTQDPLFLLAALRYAVKRRHLQDLRMGYHEALAHDLTTPIANIREGIEQVLDGGCGPLSGEQRRILQIVLKNVDFLKGFTDDLFDRP